jgi:autotransporter-associated beta strand protein
LGGLTVTNGGSVILDQDGTISGGTIIGSGSSVQLGENDQWGQLPSGAITMNGTLIFNNSSGNDVTVASVISGASTGNLVQSNANNVTLAGSSDFTGNVLVNSGTLTDTKVGNGSSGGLGATAAGKTITVNSGATLVIPQNVFGGNTVAEANMPSFIINGGTVNDTTKYTSIGSVTLNDGATLTQSPASVNNYQGYQFRGSITVGGSSPSTISTGNGADNHLDTNTVFNVADVTGDSGVDLTVSTGLRNASPDFGSVPGSLVKIGAGTMLLSGANSYTGDTTVNAGTLEIAQATLATNSTVLVANGAALRLDFPVTNTVAGLVLNGVSQPRGVYNVTTSPPYISGAGSLLVVSAAPPTPHITGVRLNGTTLTITATNGADNGTYVLLESTNVALPLTGWIPVLTNSFDGSGDLNLSTNIVNPNNAQQFYILSQ